MVITGTKTKQTQKSDETEPSIRILYHGSCPKLTPRGVGNLEYEIGIDDEIDKKYLRIANNASSGAFSTRWIGVTEIDNILKTVQDQTFKAIVLRDLYLKRSSNNHGFLAAILKAEGVLTTMPQQQTIMQLGSWDSLLEKIDSLKAKDISLPDHIAIAAKKRAKEKVQRAAAANAKKAKGNTDKTSANIPDA